MRKESIFSFLKIAKQPRILDLNMSEYLDRNQRWQSEELQNDLADAKVVIGGMGGLGWLVGGALIGLGVRQITVFDPDPLELVNFNRLWGCRVEQVGSAKVDIFKQMAQGVSSSIAVTTYTQKIPCLAFENALDAAEVVFGCYDSPEPRVATQVLARQANKLYIDTGTSIQAGKKNDFNGFGQVFVSASAHSGCVVCAGLRMDSPGYRGINHPIASSGVINGILANLAVSIWIKHLQGESIAALTQFNWNQLEIKTKNTIAKRPACAICGTDPGWATQN